MAKLRNSDKRIVFPLYICAYNTVEPLIGLLYTSPGKTVSANLYVSLFRIVFTVWLNC